MSGDPTTTARQAPWRSFRFFGERTGIKVSRLALGTGMFGTSAGRGAEPEEAAGTFNSHAEAVRRPCPLVFCPPKA